MNFKEYFSANPEQYDKKLNKGVLGWIRKQEREAILKFLKPVKGEEILDIPCGKGYYADYIVEKGASVYGVDISPEMLRVFKQKGYNGHCGDLKTFCLKKKFDKVLSAGGFEFCLEHKKIVKNLLVHAKSGAPIILLVTRKCILGRLFQVYHLLKSNTKIAIFSEKEIRETCSQSEVNTIETHPCGIFGLVVRIVKK